MLGNKLEQKGFTLIELMITVVIFSILAAIAVPSYRQYMIRNAESQAQSQMGQIEIDLQSWRATMLSYRGFTPKNIDANGQPVFKYDANDTLVYVPLGSNASNHRYTIEIFDGENVTSNSGSSLNPSSASSSSNVDPAVGRSWVMIAKPNSNGITANAKVYLQHSSGLRCATPANNISSLPLTLQDCTGAGLEKW